MRPRFSMNGFVQDGETACVANPEMPCTGQGADDEARAALPASEQITGLLADWNGTDGNAAGTTDALFEAVYAT